MKIAVTILKPDNLDVAGLDLDTLKPDVRFGRAGGFYITDDQTGENLIIDNTSNINASHGAGLGSAQLLAENNVNVVITGQVGPKAFQALNAAGIKMYSSREAEISKMLELFRLGELEEIAGY